MMRASSVAWCSIAVASAGNSPDLGWELLATTAPDVTQRTCMDAPGLPKYLQGIYVVSGPAKFETENYRFQALFDGFGKVNKFEVGSGSVCYTSAWINSTFARDSEKRGQAAGMLFEETIPARSCPLLDPMCNMKTGGDNDWVNLVQIGDDTCLLTDAPQMLKIDLETLNTEDVKVWTDDTQPSMGGAVPTWIKGGHVGTAGSAHPTRRPGTNLYVDVLSEMGPVPLQKSFLDVYTFDATKVGPQSRNLLARVPASKTPYMHGFAVTPNYVILPLNHAMNTPNMLKPTLLGTLVEHWDGIRVVDNSGEIHSFDTEKFFHVHTVNAFENATGVTMDLGAFNSSPFAKTATMDIAMFLDKNARDTNPVRNVLRRLHFHFSGPLAGEVTTQDFDQVSGSMSDFFRIHPDFTGLPYCVYYATQWWADGENYASMAIVKHDVCKDVKTLWQRPNMYPGEPEMIPGPSGAEEDGVVMFVALDGEKGTSKLVVLDAETFAELEVTELPVHIPFTAHGQFVPPLAGRLAVV